MRIKKFQNGQGGALTVLGGNGASESSKLKMAGVASLQRDRDTNNNSDLSLMKKHTNPGGHNSAFNNVSSIPNRENETTEWISGSFNKMGEMGAGERYNQKRFIKFEQYNNDTNATNTIEDSTN